MYGVNPAAVEQQKLVRSVNARVGRVEQCQNAPSPSPTLMSFALTTHA